MVRKWWVSRQIIRSKISKCRILGLKPSVFEINCHLGLTPSVFKKKFPSVDTAGRPRWCLPVARPIRSRHFRPLRADPPEPPAASGDPAGSPSALGFGPRRRRTLGYLASLGLGSVVASVQILGRRAILGGVSLGWGRFLPEPIRSQSSSRGEKWSAPPSTRVTVSRF